MKTSNSTPLDYHYQMTYAPYDSAWGPLKNFLSSRLHLSVWQRYARNMNWDLTVNITEDIAWHLDPTQS